MIRIFALLPYLALLLLAAPAGAQDHGNSEKPLEISAVQTLEWHRNKQQFIARGDAVAVQGDISIHAATLTADYRESKESSMDIYRLTAAENVVIASQGNEATGQHAVYDVDSGKAVMTGDNLRLTTPEQTVTARDRFEYDVPQGRLSASGNAVVTRGQDKLSADRVSALFTTDPATGKRVLKELTADGDVVITTPAEIVRGRRGLYNAATNIATLQGGVRIERGLNILEGEQAEVNLTTNVSRMIGATGTVNGGDSDGKGRGRVRGVFYPGSNNITAPPAPQATPLATPLSTSSPAPATTPAPDSAPVILTPPAPIRLIPPGKAR